MIVYNPGEFVGSDVELSIRNRSTGLIRDIAANGGTIGLSMYPRLAPGGGGKLLHTGTVQRDGRVDSRANRH